MNIAKILRTAFFYRTHSVATSERSPSKGKDRFMIAVPFRGVSCNLSSLLLIVDLNILL